MDCEQTMNIAFKKRLGTQNVPSRFLTDDEIYAILFPEIGTDQKIQKG